MITLVVEQIFSKDIYITPNNLNTDLHYTILNKLKQLENKCNEVGFVIKDTIEIVEKSNGKLINITNNNAILYVVKYKCKIIIPIIGENLICYINDITTAGVIGYVKIKDYLNDYEDNNFDKTPIICIVPLNRFNNSEDLKVGDKLNIKITAIRNKFNLSSIQVVGQPE